MGETAPLEEFRAKAPLIDVDELVELILYDIMTEELRERAESVWIRNSFTDPDREIDTSETPSDLDIYVVVPGWDLPVTDSGIAAVASGADPPDALAESAADFEWTSKDGNWDSAEQAWDRIPEYVRETLRRSVEIGFYARESDVEEGIIRLFDLVVGNRENFAYVEKPGAEVRIYHGDSVTINQ